MFLLNYLEEVVNINLCGEIVKHKVFGRGQITEIENNCIMVLFGDSTEKRKFIYPAALDAFLQLENELSIKEYQEYKDEIVRVQSLAQRELEEKILHDKQVLQIQAKKLKKMAAPKSKKKL